MIADSSLQVDRLSLSDIADLHDKKLYEPVDAYPIIGKGIDGSGNAFLLIQSEVTRDVLRVTRLP
jgi:hypothetical protein